MGKATAQKNQKQCIIKTAARSLAVLIAIVILFSIVFYFAQPSASSNFLYSIGMKNAAAGLSFSYAKQQDDFDSWWTSLVRNAEQDNSKNAYYSAVGLAKTENYSSEISKKEIEVWDSYTFEGKYYVAYCETYYGMQAFNKLSYREEFWENALDFASRNQWYQYNAINNSDDYVINPVIGYLQAIEDSDGKIPLDSNVLAELDELYNNKISGVYLNWESRQDLAQRVFAIIEESKDVLQSQKDIWEVRI